MRQQRACRWTTAARISSPSAAAAATRSRRPAPRAAWASAISRPEPQLPQGDQDQVLYAIRNGGFSGAIMPQNIVGRRRMPRRSRRSSPSTPAEGQGAAVADAARTARLGAGVHGQVRAEVGPDARPQADPQRPRGREGRARPAGRGRGIDELLGLDARRRELLAPGRGALRAEEAGLRGDRARQAGGRATPRRRCRRPARGDQAARAGAGRGRRARSRSCWRRSRTFPTPRPRRATPRRTPRSCARSARRPTSASSRATTSSWAPRSA